MFSIWYRYTDSMNYQQIVCATLAIAQLEWDMLDSNDSVKLCTTRP